MSTQTAPPPSRRLGLYPVAKRLLDVLAAVLGLVLLWPVFVVVALVVKLNSPGPALFLQKRVGRADTVFTLIKFRTMHWGTPDLSTEEMARRAKSPVTSVGTFLRRYSLDELPQLINILRGEMSLVGPRPSLPSQTSLNERRRLVGVEELTPGITGWAQINGRDDLTESEKVACDAYYLAHRSLGMDLRILAKTVLPVFTGRGNR